MKSHEKLITEFTDGARKGVSSHMFIDGDTLYSYGRHFPLAVRYQSPEGYQFLLNADRYSVTTSRHQSRCFELGPQVPFSALHAAGINPYALKIVDRRNDDWHQVPAPTPENPEHTRSEHTLGATLIEHKGFFYLSSIDENEPWHMRSYFLCQLKHEVDSIAKAYESLMPHTIRELNEKGEPYLRQGEWFFLPTEFKTRHLPRPTMHHVRLLDTSHYATELRTNKNLYVRGTIRHRPQNRRPQHRILRLEDVWHQAEKNLAVASWNAVGRVD